MADIKGPNRWWLGFLAAAAMVVLALYPQARLRIARGTEWQGAYAYVDTDEVAYSAYVNALVDGRPRRNDPYTGRDELKEKPQPESLFSIQFIPAYLTSWFVSISRLDTAQVFTLLSGFGAAASTLALFWLFLILTGDDRLSVAGAIGVLCLGTLASSQGAIRYLISGDAAYNYLPFLRRYIPLIPFPIFFIVFGLLWKSQLTKDIRRSLIFALSAGILLAILIFSYFFLWTAAVALTVCLFILTLASRRKAWKQTSLKFTLFVTPGILALVPYTIMLSKRSRAMDSAQLLISTHKLDLFRSPEVIGFVIIGLIIIFCRDQLKMWETSPALFALASAILPAVVFNQQLVTGHSLQPIHYEQFIGNYVVMVSVVLTIALLRRRLSSSPFRTYQFVLFGLVAFSWGVVETRKATEVFEWYNIRRDEAWAVTKRLRQLSVSDIKREGASPVVLTSVDLLADDIPSGAPAAVLWARHMHVFSGVDLAENKRRFYQLMYYTGVDIDQIRDGLENSNFYFTVALFGWDRANFNLTSEPHPVTEEEINVEMTRITKYMSGFNNDQSLEPRLSYLVTEQGDEPPLENLDKWYTRQTVEHIGNFNLYRLAPRD